MKFLNQFSSLYSVNFFYEIWAFFLYPGVHVIVDSCQKFEYFQVGILVAVPSCLKF